LIREELGEVAPAKIPEAQLKQILERVQRLIDEFRPELEALGRRVDALEKRLKALEQAVAARTVEGAPITLGAQFVYRVGLQSSLMAPPDEIDYPEDLYQVHSTRVRVAATLDEDTQAAVSYWEDNNDNPFHGRARNAHGIDEAWLSTRGWGGRWVIGRQYVRKATAHGYGEEVVGGFVGQGLVFYTPTAVPGVSYETQLGSLDLTLFSTMSVLQSDGEFIGRVGFNIGRLQVGGNILYTGVVDEKAWSADVVLPVLGRTIVAEYAQQIENRAGQDLADDTAFVVGIPDLVDARSLQIGVKYGEVKRNYQIVRSILTNPYYLRLAELPFDRPLFLDPANVAKGWEVTVGLNIARTPISVRWYDGDTVAGANANSVLTVALRRAISRRANVDLLYGLQENGAGAGLDLQVLRAQLAVGF